MAKYTHKDVDYRDDTLKKRCGTCSMYLPPGRHRDEPDCTAVMEPIRTDGVCNIWREKT